MASSRRILIGSMAMIVDAPAIRAPCTALSPSGPQPTTATADPGATTASVPDVVAPSPATLTQLRTIPRSTAVAFVTTGHDPLLGVIINSARPPMCEFE